MLLPDCAAVKSIQAIFIFDLNHWFQVVQKLCEKLRAEPRYLAKSEIVRSYFKQHPSSPDETYLMLKQMIPSIDKRVFNVKDKQVKLIVQVTGVW